MELNSLKAHFILLALIFSCQIPLFKITSYRNKEFQPKIPRSKFYAQSNELSVLQKSRLPRPRNLKKEMLIFILCLYVHDLNTFQSFSFLSS
jgi:hypothetical protein